MNVGIMLRHLRQHGGGVLVYTRQLLERLFAAGRQHSFTLLYPDSSLIGTYAAWENVREVALNVPTKILWDQFAAPWLARREHIDVLFNPKYSLPLLTGRPSVFVCHGLDWYVMPWGQKWPDRLNHKFLIPLFVKKSAAIIAVSNATREHFVDHFHYDPARVLAVYLGVSDAFRHPVPEERKTAVSEKYGLPEQYVLYVGQIYPPKNMTRLLEAFASVGPALGVSLVIAGDESSFGGHELASISRLGIEDYVIRPGWIDHDELPAFYHLAEALLMPSLYEACPSPILEAMSCGCPIVTSDRYGTKDLAGGTALLVDPEDVADIARGLREMLADESVRQQYVARGRERVKAFSYERCAAETLQLLESVYEASRNRGDARATHSS